MMDTCLTVLEGAFWCIIHASWQASVLVGVVLSIQWAFRKQLAPRWRYSLWAVVVVRLMLPVVPESSLSVFNLGKLAQPVADRHERAAAPEAHSISNVPEAGRPRSPRPVLPVGGGEDASPGMGALDAESAGASTASRAAEAQPSDRAAREASGSTWNPMTMLPVFWLLGVALFGARMAAACYRLSRRLARLGSADAQDVEHLLKSCKGQMGVTGTVRVLESTEDEPPALIGCWRPKVLMPKRFAAAFSPGELRFILLHELGHVRRRDVAVRLLTSALGALHWFNPVIWLAWHRMRQDCELACDELVLSRLQSTENTDYGRTIIRVLESLSPAVARPGVACILEDKASIHRRIVMISRFKRPGLFQGVFAALLLLTLAVVGLSDGVPRDQNGDRQTGQPTERAPAVTPPGEADPHDVDRPGEDDVLLSPVEIARFPDLARVIRVFGHRPFLHWHDVDSLALVDGGKTLLTSSRHGLRVWDVAAGTLSREIALPGPNDNFMSVDRSGRIVATAGDFGEVRLIDWPSGETIEVVSDRGPSIESFALDPEGTKVAVGRRFRDDPDFIVRDAGTGRRLFEHDLGAGTGEVSAIAWSPKGDLVAAGNSKGEVSLWGEDGERVRPDRMLDPSEPPAALAFSPEGDRLAVITLHGSVSLWDVATGQRRWGVTGPATGHNLVGGGSTGGITFDASGRKIFARSGRRGMTVSCSHDVLTTAIRTWF
ncbi:MAG: M56 family metallopeptidase [Planctomycetota bacterium]|jgi:bla regulator protein BlaR1